MNCMCSSPLTAGMNLVNLSQPSLLEVSLKVEIIKRKNTNLEMRDIMANCYKTLIKQNFKNSDIYCSKTSE